MVRVLVINVKAYEKLLTICLKSIATCDKGLLVTHTGRRAGINSISSVEDESTLLCLKEDSFIQRSMA